MDMLSKTCNDRDFNEALKEVNHNEKLELVNNNCLRIYTLPIANNKFNYTNLKNVIKDNIKGYVFSRSKIKEAIEKDIGDRLIFEALGKFREIKNNGDKGKGAELGEILLYFFLESQLKAKKILSKMELKTSRNDYVKGADGVFLYSYVSGEYNCFDFIIGEAKLQNKVDDAIEKAFDSIKDHMNVNEFEYNLVNDNIFKESVTEDEAEELKKIIIPSNSGESKVLRNDAFGIFIGYSLDVDVISKPYPVAIKEIEEEILQNISHIKEKFNEKIKEFGLSNYSFYVYILPFNNVSEDRENIMRELLGV